MKRHSISIWRKDEIHCKLLQVDSRVAKLELKQQELGMLSDFENYCLMEDRKSVSKYKALLELDRDVYYSVDGKFMDIVVDGKLIDMCKIETKNI